MLPFAEACQGLERAVRDLAAGGGKQVELVIEGGDVELDRSILEGLKDPLIHLVRNAVDHGLEPPERRRAGGQAPARAGSRSPRRCGVRRWRWSSPTTAAAWTWTPCASRRGKQGLAEPSDRARPGAT